MVTKAIFLSNFMPKQDISQKAMGAGINAS